MMLSKDDLLKREILLKQLRSIPEKQGILKRLSNRKRKKKTEKLEQKQNSDCDQFLLINDPEYKKIAEKNLELFCAEDLDFKVVKIVPAQYDYNVMINGSVHQNGVSYLDRIPKISLFNLRTCPSKFIGRIDHWGNITLKSSNNSSKLLENTPRSYKGSIDKTGKIELILNETEFTLPLGNGYNGIGRMMADHFFGDERKKDSFIQNSEKLRSILNVFRNSLC